MKTRCGGKNLLRTFKKLIDIDDKKLKSQTFLIAQKSFFNYALGFSKKESKELTRSLFKRIKKTKSLKKERNYLVNLVKPRLSLFVVKWTKKRAIRDFKIVKKWLRGTDILNIKAGRGHLGLKIRDDLGKNVIMIDEHNIELFLRECLKKNKKFDTVLISGELHHLRHLGKLLKEISKITKKRLIIFEPRIFFLKNSIGISEKDWLELNLFSEWLFDTIKFKENKINPNNGYNQINYQKLKKLFSLVNFKLEHEEYIIVEPSEVIIHHHWLFILKKQNEK